MRRIYQTAAIVLFLSSVAFAQKSHRAFVSRDEQAVRQIEDQVSAALDHNDADALDRLWAADYMFVNPFGIVMTKAQRLSLFRSGKLK